MKYKYVIRGDYGRAIVVHSDLDFEEFKEFFYKNYVEKLHEKSYETVFVYGAMEFIDPIVMLPEEFVDYCPIYLWLEVKKSYQSP